VADGAFLRRPISVAGFDGASRRARFIVRAAGHGTEAIASLEPGDEIRALMPLGNTFPADRLAPDARVWLVGGGIGAAPLLYTADYIKKAAPAREIKSFLGFRDARGVFGADELSGYGEVFLDVGGFVTEKILTALESGRPDVIFSCGPEPMLAALKKICREHNLPAYVSLEARMGCGVGACLVCAHKTDSERTEYKRVCRDGPVFDITETAL
jgi:dihydroorotate dehydrogenase electron transfer subunit